MERIALGLILDVLVCFQNPFLTASHAALDVDGLPSERSGKGHSFIAHLLQVTDFSLGWVFGSNGCRTNEDADISLLASFDNAADAIQIGLFVLLVRLGTPADIVDAVGDGQHRCPVREHVPFEPLESPCSGISTDASI